MFYYGFCFEFENLALIDGLMGSSRSGFPLSSLFSLSTGVSLIGIAIFFFQALIFSVLN